MPEEKNNDTTIGERLIAMKLNTPRREGEEALWMKRVPTDTVKEFKALAQKFCDDYGMTLKALVDHYQNKDIQQAMVQKIFEHDQVIKSLIQEVAINKKPQTSQIQQVKVRVMANGKTLAENSEIEKKKEELIKNE